MSKFVDQFTVTDESGNCKKEININFGDPLAREQSQKAMQTSEQAKQTANEAKQIAQEAKDAVPGQVSQQVEEATQELSGQIAEAKEEVQNVGVKNGRIQWTDNEVLNPLILGIFVVPSGPQPIDVASLYNTYRFAIGKQSGGRYYLQMKTDTTTVGSVYFNGDSKIKTCTVYKDGYPAISFAMFAPNSIYAKTLGIDSDLNINFKIKAVGGWAVFELIKMLESTEAYIPVLNNSDSMLNSLVLPLLPYNVIYKNVGDVEYTTLSQPLSVAPELFAYNNNVENIAKCDCEGISEVNRIFGWNDQNPNYPTTGRRNMKLKSVVFTNFNPGADKMVSFLRDMEALQSVTFANGTDTSAVTDLSSAFFHNYGLVSLDVSMLNFSNVRVLKSAFSEITNLRSLKLPPNLSSDSKIIENANGAFNYTKISNLSVPGSEVKVLSATMLFRNCNYTESIDIAWDFSECASLNNAFQTEFIKQPYILTSFSGFKNVRVSYDISSCPFLNHESALNCINGLYDFTEGGTVTGYTAQTLTFHEGVKAQLTEEEIAEATVKGWNIA